ncbi:hypothetical protein VHP8226_02178 [Vibrio hippocampi]|uniref:Uncharacterized protein n=1 Tax=Vibrio hippocampi TaxID=654686 RepID=A0ABN8DJN6_9VIBR|nr:hypothetical protein VHP8226_02178 [Vibrio hippocampi]
MKNIICFDTDAVVVMYMHATPMSLLKTVCDRLTVTWDSLSPAFMQDFANKHA